MPAIIESTKRIYQETHEKSMPDHVLDQTLAAAHAAYEERGYDFMILTVRSRMEECLQRLDVSSTSMEADLYHIHEALLQALETLEIESN